MKCVFLAALSMILIGCESNLDLGIPGHELAVAQGLTIEDLKKVRPQVHFVPYLGWIDSLTDDQDFAQASFELYRDALDRVAPSGGKLWSVRLYGRDTSRNEAIKNGLTTSMGTQKTIGCAKSVERNFYQVYSWPSSRLLVVGIVLIDSVGREVGPLSVHVAHRGESLSSLTKISDPMQRCPSENRAGITGDPNP